MLSKGKKIEYTCPNCGSGNIYRSRFHPVSFYASGEPLGCIEQKSGECKDCNTWWPWRSRIKKSLRKNMVKK